MGKVNIYCMVFKYHVLGIVIALSCWRPMELKTARLTLLMDPKQKAASRSL